MIILNTAELENAKKYYWDARPEHFIDKNDGMYMDGSFNGDTVLWFHTLGLLLKEIYEETKFDKILLSPDLEIILECLVYFMPTQEPVTRIPNQPTKNFSDFSYKVGDLIIKEHPISVLSNFFAPRNIIHLYQNDKVVSSLIVKGMTYDEQNNNVQNESERK